MKLFCTLLLLAIISRPAAQTKQQEVDEVAFFKDESVMEVTITTNLKQLSGSKMKEGQKYPALFGAKMPDGSIVTEPITLEVRGKYRKENCDIPPLKVGFKNENSPTLSPLGSLKLVNVCKPSINEHSQFLLKEYLIYKIYNLLTDKSFRVRLLKITYQDSTIKRKIEDYAFLMEDLKDMAKRNECVERKRPVKHTENTDRNQMTRLALFEYMIANLDWSVPVGHNIKLIVNKADTNKLPFPVPYDFDHSGLVETDYALPPTQINVEHVTDRNYRGYSREVEELELAGAEFLNQKTNIYKLINEFDLLPSTTRKQMIKFLDAFFAVLEKPAKVKTEFIQNALKG